MARDLAPTIVRQYGSVQMRRRYRANCSLLRSTQSATVPRLRWLHVETGGPTAQRSSFVREESFREEGNLETKSIGETVKRVTEYHRVFQRPLE